MRVVKHRLFHLWNIPGWVGWGLEEPGIMEGGSAHGRGVELDGFEVPSNPNHSLFKIFPAISTLTQSVSSSQTFPPNLALAKLEQTTGIICKTQPKRIPKVGIKGFHKHEATGTGSQKFRGIKSHRADHRKQNQFQPKSRPVWKPGFGKVSWGLPKILLHANLARLPHFLLTHPVLHLGDSPLVSPRFFRLWITQNDPRLPSCGQTKIKPSLDLLRCSQLPFLTFPWDNASQNSWILGWAIVLSVPWLHPTLLSFRKFFPTCPGFLRAPALPSSLSGDNLAPQIIDKDMDQGLAWEEPNTGNEPLTSTLPARQSGFYQSNCVPVWMRDTSKAFVGHFRGDFPWIKMIFPLISVVFQMKKKWFSNN